MSNKDPAAVATSFLLNAPPGEFQQTAAAIQGLTGDQALTDAARADSFKSWAHKNCHTVTVNDKLAILCDEAQLGEDVYLDPHTGTAFRYDFASHAVEPAQAAAANSAKRQELQGLMVEYAKSAYKSNVGVGVYDADKQALAIVLTSSSISLRNYRTGSVKAQYRLEANGKLTGTVAVMQHFFENGNVMCEQSANLDATVKGGDMKACVEKIREFENGWLKGYVEAFDRLSSEGMTKLRRKMAISGTRINWEAEFRGITGMGMQ